MLLLAIHGCTEPTEPSAESFAAADAPFSSAVIRRVETGGFDAANNQGSIFFFQWTPEEWEDVPYSGDARGVDEAGEPIEDACNDTTTAVCQVGTLTALWGTLGTAPFPEPNEGTNDLQEYAVMTNANFVALNTGAFVRTRETAIQHTMTFDGASPNAYYELQVDAAFGTGQRDTGPGQNDHAVVEFIIDGRVHEVLRWERDDLQPGGQGPSSARSRKDCGTVQPTGLVDVNGNPVLDENGDPRPQGHVENYPLCTDWERHFIPLADYTGPFDQEAIIRIRIIQDGEDNDLSSFLAIDNIALLGYDIFEVPLQILAANRLTKRYIEVALLADGTFPVSEVDAGSLVLEEQGVARLSNGTPLTSFSDVNRDGVTDIIARFDRQATLAGGSYSSGSNTLHLNGMLKDRSRIHGTATLVLQ